MIESDDNFNKIQKKDLFTSVLKWECCKFSRPGGSGCRDEI